MPALSSRDVEYRHGDTRMLGLLIAPDGASHLPTVLMIHDAFGLGEDARAQAERLATLGFAVFAADVWGERHTPTSEDQIGPLIGSVASDRTMWMGRLSAAHEAAASQAETDPDRIVALGYCVGGSGVLEYVRTGGRLAGAVAIHPGLDLLAPGWDACAPGARVLTCVGADDPMATAAMRRDLEDAMTAADVDWETDLYSGTKHAFTSPKSEHSPMPDVVAYSPRSAARAWASTARFLGEAFAESPSPVG